MLRIIAGRYRRRHLKSLPGRDVRPMLDSLRETLFNILRDRIVGKVFVDLYAGTGAAGIEALSRGASRAVFVDKSPTSVGVIRENLALVGAEQDAQVFSSSVQDALPGISGDIVFLGPPYELAGEYETTLQALGQSPPEIVIAQHARSRVLAERYGRLQRFRVVNQGNNSLSFYAEATE